MAMALSNYLHSWKNYPVSFLERTRGDPENSPHYKLQAIGCACLEGIVIASGLSYLVEKPEMFGTVFTMTTGLRTIQVIYYGLNAQRKKP